MRNWRCFQVCRAYFNLYFVRHLESDVAAFAGLHVATEQLADRRRLDNVESYVAAESARFPVLRTGNRIRHHALDSVRAADIDHREGRHRRVSFLQ